MLSFFGGLLCLLLPFVLLSIFSKHPSFLESPRFKARYSSLTEVLRFPPSTLRTHFFALFVVRRLCFVMVIFFLHGLPWLQTPLLASQSVLLIMWLLYAKPLREKSVLKLEIFNECLLLLILLLLGSL